MSRSCDKIFKLFFPRTSNIGNIFFLLTWVVVILSQCHLVKAQDLMCCSHATGSCRSVCEKISLVQLAADQNVRNQTLEQVQKFCSSQLREFWDCLNATFKDISRGQSWSGRLCCPLPHSESCRKACITATSAYDLAQGCRQSDEISFFACLDHQRQGETCCGGNATASDQCRDACLDIFKTALTPNKSQRERVLNLCEARVFECVRDFVKVTPAKNLLKHLHCCDASPEANCRETCKRVLTSKSITLQEMVDSLQTGGCGYPLPQDYFWQCFLKKPNQPAVDYSSSSVQEVSTIEKLGMDSAKWHCCHLASSDHCQRLCSKTFTKFWSTSWDEFHRRCLAAVDEQDLRNCIEEVDEPCELGCDGLSFCTNFNNRPTELFRSCTSQADEAARNDVTMWLKEDEISLPGLTLPLRNDSDVQCSPNIWKAVACTMQIKPCLGQTNHICRDVCLEILSRCIDWTRVAPDNSADTICGKLSSSDSSDCIKLDEFMVPSDLSQRRLTEVSSPCKGNPCEPYEACLLNRNGTNKGYTCVPGCKLGEVSEYMVPHGTYVKIPLTNYNNDPRGCLKICRCNGGKIEECQPLPCVSLTPCLLGTSLHQLHGTSFQIDNDCNWCSCFAGEVICSKKQCQGDTLSGRNTAYTTLPCNCSPHYVPVCGRDGNTYPSACLAKCAGLSDSDIEHFPCGDPCRSTNCPVGQKCVPHPQVCLSLMHKPCKQSVCVNGTTNCQTLPKSPVCDVDGLEHANLCHLAHHNTKLAYEGPCLKNCKSSEGKVCGINGRTYQSECAAFADMVLVDYKGPCIAIGLITDDTKARQCPHITCPPLPSPDCWGITPPGACCPQCGGALRLLYSRKQIDRALYATLQSDRNYDTESLNLKAVLKGLERQVQISQCVLKGYLTVESDLFVLIHSSDGSPSEIQLEACVREAEKIGNLINSQSPRIVSDLSLSPLTLARVVHTRANSAAGASEFLGVAKLLFLLLTVVRIL